MTTRRKNNTDILIGQIQKFITDQEKIITLQEGYPMSENSFSELESDVLYAVEEAVEYAFSKISFY